MKPGDMLSGETAFKLYDTYGFPLDLTQDAVRNKGLSVDLSGFEDAMRRQRDQAREAWTGSGQAAAAAEWFSIRERLGATEFLGYDTERAEGVVQALVRDGKAIERASLYVVSGAWFSYSVLVIGVQGWRDGFASAAITGLIATACLLRASAIAKTERVILATLREANADPDVLRRMIDGRPPREGDA